MQLNFSLNTYPSKHQFTSLYCTTFLPHPLPYPSGNPLTIETASSLVSGSMMPPSNPLSTQQCFVLFCFLFMCKSDCIPFLVKNL